MPEIRVSCPGCQATLKLADTLAGKKIRCPKCKAIVSVPALGAPPAPAPAPAAPPVRARPAAPPPEPAPAPLAEPEPSPDEEFFAEEPPPSRRPAPADEDEMPPAAVARAPLKKRRPADEDEDDRPRGRRQPPDEEEEPAARKPAKKRGGVLGILATFMTVLMLLAYGGGVVALQLEFVDLKPVELPGLLSLNAYKQKLNARAKKDKDKDKGKELPSGDAPELKRDEGAEKTAAAMRKMGLDNLRAAELKTAEMLGQHSSRPTDGLAIARVGGNNDPPTMGQTTFARDGRTLAERRDNSMVLWDLSSGRRQELKDAKDARAFAFSQDSRTLYTARDKTLIAWDVQKGEHSRSLIVPFLDAEPVFSPGGQKFAAIPAQGTPTPKVWENAAGGAMVTLEGTYLSTGAKAFRPDGKVLALACQPKGQGQMIMLYNVEDGKRYKRTIVAAADALAFSPDGWTLAVKKDRELRLFDLAAESAAARVLAHEGHVGSFVFTPDGKHVLTSTDNHLRVWDAAGGKEVRKLDLRLGGLNVSPGGVFLIADSRQVWLLSDLLDDATSKNVAEAKKLAEVRREGLGFSVQPKADAKPDVLAQLRKLLGRLTAVSVTGGEGGDAWLTAVKAAPELRRLSLVGVKGLSDQGLANLAGLKELEELDLSGAEEVGDAGLAHLHKLSKLKQVVLKGTKATDQGAAGLRKAVQGVKVVK